jgi:tetrahydromethanopterin S-methyltransferase subunit G
MSDDMTKITKLEIQMKHTGEKLDSLKVNADEGFKTLNKKFDELCEKIDDNYVRKDTYKIEKENIDKDLAFVKGVIFSGAGIFVLYVLNSIFEIL